MTKLHEGLFSKSTAAMAGILTFVLSVVTGLHYVSSAFATTQPGAPLWLHFASAAAVEVGVLFIGLTLAIRSAEGDRNLRLYAGVVLFVGVSIIANYDAAATAVLGGPLTWEALQQLDRWTLIKAGALGGVVPLMVLMSLEALRELAQVGGPPAPGKAEQQGKGRDKGKKGGRQNGHVERYAPGRQVAIPDAEMMVAEMVEDPEGQAVVSKAASKAMSAKPAKRRRKKRGTRATPEQLRAAIEKDPTLNASQLARLLNCSRATIYNWLDAAGVTRDEYGGEWRLA